jgi:hypothetical protein
MPRITCATDTLQSAAAHLELAAQAAGKEVRSHGETSVIGYQSYLNKYAFTVPNFYNYLW